MRDALRWEQMRDVLRWEGPTYMKDNSLCSKVYAVDFTIKKQTNYQSPAVKNAFIAG